MSNKLKLLREKAIRPRRTVPVLLDGEVRAQIEAVEDELDRLDGPPVAADRRLSTRSQPPADRVAELTAEVERLRAAAVEQTLFVVVEGMPGTPYRALIAQHPPRKGEDGKTLPSDLAGVNDDTFRRPLLEACIIGQRDKPDADAPMEPLDPDSVQWLLDWVTDRQMDQLFAAALAVCRGDDAVPLSRRRSTTPASDDA